jgi:hypothetical protein
MPASFTRFGTNHTSPFMPTKPSIWEFLPQPERDHIPPRNRQDRQVWPGYWIYHNRDDSISFGTEEREYFGWLPAEITRAVPESVINTIASMVCHAHRMGRKEAHDYLKQFVLEQMRVPDWPHYPMNDLRKNDSSSATTYTGQVATALINRKGEAGNQFFPCFSHSHLRTSVHCPELRASSSAKRGSCESWGKGAACSLLITCGVWVIECLNLARIRAGLPRVSTEDVSKDFKKRFWILSA